MATIQITLSDQEKTIKSRKDDNLFNSETISRNKDHILFSIKKADTLFKGIGMTTSGAIKVFLNQAIQEQGFPFTPKIRRQTTNPYAIYATTDENGTIILPEDTPDDVKNWVKYG